MSERNYACPTCNELFTKAEAIRHAQVCARCAHGVLGTEECFTCNPADKPQGARTFKGLLLEMKLAPSTEERFLAEDELIKFHEAMRAELTSHDKSLIKRDVEIARLTEERDEFRREVENSVYYNHGPAFFITTKWTPDPGGGPAMQESTILVDTGQGIDLKILNLKRNT